MTTVQTSTETLVTTPVEKKARKPRSDKGLKRGNYKPRVAKG